MSPQRQLVLGVTLVTAAIAVAWGILFRNNVLTPPIERTARGLSFEDISQRFREQVEQFEGPPLTVGAVGREREGQGEPPSTATGVFVPPTATGTRMP